MTISKDALWASGHDESVEVNQRALIDKVLARYSGEFTVFRELLQNSDDAQSSSVEIRFVTGSKEGETPDLKTTLATQWTFKNNGILFREEDWNRLRKIAEGNPDEEKIGAFGVGFYSLFSVTEEPFVTSGDKWMGFYWKDNKDQLFARRGQLPQETTSSWTSFEMPLRDPAPIPSAFDLTRFLASSITFMVHLSEVSVYVDDKRLSRLTKTTGVTRPLTIPTGLNRVSPSKTMRVTSLQSTAVHIQAQVMRWVYESGSQKLPPPPPPVPATTKPSGLFSSLGSMFTSLTRPSAPTPAPTPPPPPPEPIDLLHIGETSVTLAIFSAGVDVTLDTKMKDELYRSTKKNAPPKVRYDLIYTGKEEYDASVEEDARVPYATGSLFQELRADLDGAGSAHISIGHKTAQTTGMGGHMAARFIPTVERESIDLMDRNVAIWNKELLYVGGFLARAAYTLEMDKIRQLWTPSTSSHLTQNALHILKFFSFHPSTPSSDVSSLMQSAFFGAGKDIPFASTQGVRDASAVRSPADHLDFIHHLPVIPALLTQHPRISRVLDVEWKRRGYLSEISFDDVVKELRQHPLDESDAVKCLKWWTDVVREIPHMTTQRTALTGSLIISLPNDTIVSLSTIKSFVNKKTGYIPTDGPLPDSVLPYTLSKHFEPEVLKNVFGLHELTLMDYVSFLVRNGHPIDLSVLAKSWPSQSVQTKAGVVRILKDVACVPTTTSGLQKPGLAYFASADVFKDLAVVDPTKLTVKGPMEKLLADLGVRKHLSLELVFERMIKTESWSAPDLIKYLVSVKATLTSDEWERLKQTRAFLREGEGEKRYMAKELYEPVDALRGMGLPVVDWHGAKWRTNTDSATFLYALGLKKFPPLDALVELCAKQDDKGQKAFKYLLDHVQTHYKDAYHPGFTKLAFIPCIRDGKPALAAPTQVYSEPEWAILGFDTIAPNLPLDASTKLGIPKHPRTRELVSLLQKTPPKDEDQARKWFPVIASRVSDFSSSDLDTLSKTAFVPAKARYFPPTQCFFGKSQFHSKFFTFVDFGSSSNAFLAACGSKREPSVDEIVHMLLSNPHRFYELAEGRDNFLLELRNIAVNSRLLSSVTLTLMKRAPILLGMKRSPNKNKKKEGDDEDEWTYSYDLKRADEIVVADDPNAYHLFGEHLFSAPQEDVLEEFYMMLGSRKLSAVVKEEYKAGPEQKGHKYCTSLRSLVLERLPLFLHEHEYAKNGKMKVQLTPDNFLVRVFGSLTVTRSFEKVSKPSQASAVAQRAGFNGPIQLWVASNVTVDMYEVAISLCRHIFVAPKASDALLFMTLLSTDHDSLRRRGYNVDRIIKRQREEKQKEQELLSKQEPPPKMTSQVTSVPTPPPTRAPSPPPKSLSGWVERLTGKPSEKSLLEKPPAPYTPPSRPDTPKGMLPPMPGSFQQPSPGPSRPTPQGSIDSNINMAIRDCKPDKDDNHVLHNREHMQQVKESLEDGYCDISGRVGDIRHVGSIADVKVYTSLDVDPSVIPTKQASITRFVSLIKPLRTLYGLHPQSLHIFYDTSGDTIAFNRNASLFLNLRFYEAWHDDQVARNMLKPAYISWYFTLAHEIAHNLVQPHNSEHEFYFSAICEKYLLELGKLMDGLPA